MGEYADQAIEQGMDDWLAHKAGECGQDGPCQYCYENEQRNAKRRKAYHKKRREEKKRARR